MGAVEVPGPIAFSAQDAVLLAHALAHALSASAGVRVLSLKGPVADAYQLRPPRIAADADLIVEPGNAGRLVEELAKVGFTPRRTSTLARTLTDHSVTLVHPHWPCDIDLHTYFPGFHVPPSALFEGLWQRHLVMEMAGASVPVVGRFDAIVMAALHLLRDPRWSRTRREEAKFLVERVLPDLDPESMLELARIATEMGASESAAPLLGVTPSEGLQPPYPPQEDALSAWRFRVAGSSTQLVLALGALPRIPWRRRPTFLARAIWPSEEDMRLDHPEIVAGRGPLFRARIARVGRGFRSIPGVVRGYRLAKRGVTDASALKDPQ